MKVLIINGSPHLNGNTDIALKEMTAIFEEEEIDTETVMVGNKDIRGCIACNTCGRTGRCVFDDVVNELAQKLKEADGLVLATPVYYASANATLIACLDRLFYSTHFDKTMKVGASVVVARRGGCSATFDELNKYFTISGMPVVSSSYWNSVHGREAGEAACDAEGLQVMRTLARNMAFLMKSIAIGKASFGLPEKEEWKPTHFIREDLIKLNEAAGDNKEAAEGGKTSGKQADGKGAGKKVRASRSKETDAKEGKRTPAKKPAESSADQVKPSVRRAVNRAKKAAQKQELAKKKAAAKRNKAAKTTKAEKS